MIYLKRIMSFYKNISHREILVFILLPCIIFISLFLSSCIPSTPINNNTPPEMTKVSVYRSVQGNYAGSSLPVCLVLDSDNTCEKIDIIVEFSNPDKRTISQMTINDVLFKSMAFDEDTTAERVIIKDYFIDQTEGEYELKIEKIYYQLPNEQKLVQKMASNIIDILVAPVFNITLDVSQGRQHQDYVPLLVKENNYQDRLNLFIDTYMQETTDIPGQPGEEGYTFGKVGYTFGGWYDQPDGQGRQYRFTDYFTDNKDLKLYAFYELTCTYSIVEGEDSFAKVTGLTSSGLTNPRIEILDEFEELPVREIGENAFKNMSGTRTIVLPDSVIKIKSRAFDSASSITIDLNNVEEIEEYAFSSCGTLNIGSLPSSLKHIGEGAFMGCTWKTKIYNPDSELSIFFESNDVLVIPATLLSIGNSAFKNSKFKSVYFWESSSLESFGSEVFANSNVLTKVITSTTFSGSTSQLTSSIEPGLKEIGYRWFYECTSLILDRSTPSSSILCSGLEVIGEQAFASGGLGSQAGLTKVVSVQFPNSLKKIGKQAFYNTKMREVLFFKESNFQEIGDRAFQNTRLTTLTFFSLSKFGPAPFLGSPIEYLIFELDAGDEVVEYVPHPILSLDNTGLSIGNGFSRFAKIYVPSEKLTEYNNLESSGWWKDTKGGTDDWQPILDIDSIHTFPGSSDRISFEEIGDNEIRITNIFRATGTNESMQNIEIRKEYNGKTVTEIGSFVSCDDTLVSVTLPYTVKVIKDSAFRGASGLIEVKWKDEEGGLLNKDEALETILLESIEPYAFSNTALIEFRSNARLKTIGIKAFSACKQMRIVELIIGPKESEVGGGQLEIGISAFSNCGIDLSIVYPMVDITINANIIKTMGENNILGGVFQGAKLVDIYIFAPVSSNPTGYEMPIHYYTFGNSFNTIPTIYFNSNNGYEMFLPDGGTNQYFNFGYCPWDESDNVFIKDSEDKSIVVSLN